MLRQEQEPEPALRQDPEPGSVLRQGQEPVVRQGQEPVLIQGPEPGPVLRQEPEPGLSQKQLTSAWCLPTVSGWLLLAEQEDTVIKALNSDPSSIQHNCRCHRTVSGIYN